MAHFFQGARHTYASNSNFTAVGGDQIVHNTFAGESNSALEALKPAVERSSAYVSPCAEGTRLWVFDQIYLWLQDIEAPNILLLTGSPGAGKSTIAWTLASKLEAESRLGCDFFFKRDDVTLGDPTTIWRTVAYKLAQRNTDFADRVIENLKAGRVDPLRVDIDLHFEVLIKDPAAWVFRKSTQAPAQGRDAMEANESVEGNMDETGVTGPSTAMFPVVILDALDECGSDPSQSTQRRIFMHTITKWLHLHPMIKLVITSRDQGLSPGFRNACHRIILETGDLVSNQSNLDIQSFFEKRLAHIASQYPSLRSWPGESIIKQLTARAAGLFIWAETVARFLEQDDDFPDEQLKLVLGGNFHKEGNTIDELYHQILHRSFKSSKPHVLDMFRKVVGAILLAKVPLHRHDLYHFLLGALENRSSIDFILNKLSTVISQSDADRPIHIIHLSFFEFMCDPKRCPERFFINHNTHNQIMALACFRVMNTGLKFNICQIETSYLPNDALDLGPRIKKAIPTHLSYSCLFGAEHLRVSIFDGEILQEVKKLMYNQLLSWLEVLSLLKETKTASRTLLLIREWSSIDENLVGFSRDASKFVAAFMSVISRSAPHIYLSALPFAAKQSKVLQQYLPRFPQMIFIEDGQATDWPAIQNVLNHPTASRPECIAFSQDGKHIVSGSNYGAIVVWDADTGVIIPGAREADDTICVWEMETGEITSKRWHESGIRSSVCSWNGKCVVLGSEDGSIHIYDAEIGAVVAGPFQTHKSGLVSAACSRDVKYIVSGSIDGTVCVYNLQTETALLSTFHVHTTAVTHLALSPDGRRIISSSQRETRIWNTETGVILSGSFERNLSCAAFSPDGQHIVLCSYYAKAICILDANTGATISGPFHGHTGFIWSVTFSPDGQRVVSCSQDGTIRIWDTTGKAFFSGPEQGHAGGITSVAFSQDSKYVVSSSMDHNICIWNAETGAISSPPFESHAWVAIFSEDSKHIVLQMSDHRIAIWDVDIRKYVSNKSVPGFFPPRESVISRHGRHAIVDVATSGKIHMASDQGIYIWNTEMEIVTSGPFDLHHKGPFALSHDGKRMVSGGRLSDAGIHICGPETAAVVFGLYPLGSDIICSVAFSWDDKLVVGSFQNGMVCIWHVETGAIASGPFQCCTGYCGPIAISPDSKRIVSCSSDRTICIWDTETGELMSGPFHGHTDMINSIAFSPDGKLLVSGSEDMTIRIWAVEAKENALQIKSDEFLPAFKDDSAVVDGWVVGPNSELLFWLPPVHQTGLWRPSNVSVIGKHSTRINFSRFVHGAAWARCSSPR